MKLFRLDSVVFVVAFAVLSWNLWNVGMASGYIDPVLHLGAGDEAAYTREAIHMARNGGWMTPDFLGRWIFEKPPLLMWLSAVSMKVFGIGRMSARLPVVLAGALICTLCFSMVRGRRSVGAGLATAAMALSSQILFSLSRHGMTDILLTAAELCAFAVLLRDPELRGYGALWSFAFAVAAGIMAKSVAGILILVVMGVVVGFGSHRWGLAALAAALAIGLASPWFLYNLFLHRDWLAADMRFQIFTVGTGAHHMSRGSHIWFYLVRLLNSDLAPLLLSLTGIPALRRAIRNREAAGLLMGSYFAVYLAALMIFRFHSEQYLCWFVPSLILIAGVYSPLLNGRNASIVTAVVAIAFVIKLQNPNRDFGISMRSGSTIAVAAALSHYCTESRVTDLYILGIDDEQLSAVLPLDHVRYGWIDPTDRFGRQHPHLAYLGILIPAGDLPKLNERLSLYRDRLLAWGLDSTRAVASMIESPDVAGLLGIIRDHPESDFLVSRSILRNPETDPAHRVAIANPNFTLLESTMPVSSAKPAWTCAM